ncbi:MAG: hypothetical protein HY246_02235 [Proteobacteria bacterium]|nr:hypothetical protein [Pseudomonadota bacterium]
MDRLDKAAERLESATQLLDATVAQRLKALTAEVVERDRRIADLERQLAAARETQGALSATADLVATRLDGAIDRLRGALAA